MYKNLLGQEGGDMGELDKNAISLLGNEEFFAYVFLEVYIEHNPTIQKKT